MADDRPDRSSRRWLKTKWFLGLGLTGLGAVAPAAAEAHAHAQLRTAGLGHALVVSLDLAGLELHNLTRTLPGSRARVELDRVRVRPGFDGLRVELEGLRQLAPEPAPAAPTSSEAPAPTKPTTNEAPAEDPLATTLARLRGIPIEIVHEGAIEIELDEGLWLRAEEVQVQLPGDGRIHGEGRFGLGSSEAAPSWLDANLRFEARDTDPRDLAVHGHLAGTADGHALFVDGRASTRDPLIELELDDGSEGRAKLIAGRDRLHLDATNFPLVALGPLFDEVAHRVDELTRERGSKLGLDQATVSGTIELAHDDERSTARFDAVEIGGLEIDTSLLSSQAVALAPLTIDGELGRVDATESGRRHYASVIVAHRGVQASLSAQLDDRSLSFDFQVPRSPCQAVLDATPGLSPVLAGTELSGELTAHFGLDLDFAALAEARARYVGEDAHAFDLESFDPPGELRFSLPYLEQCRVERLGPGIDIEGLTGAYRHDFVDAEGRTTRRVLAAGDTGYVPITRVPRLALAFVITEDALFRRHDGFDREQIEKAFWFNLLDGRVSRGASTITQQTARTLWLGVDRSLTRKLAEAMLGAELERGLDKRRILEIYLNLIELGPGIHGIADAARYHFGKEAEELSLIQALHLASLAPAPVTYSKRFADGTIDKAWRKHLRHQVHRLQIRHLITAEVAREATRVDLQLRRH